PAASNYYGWSRDKLISMNTADINTMPNKQVKRQLTIANDKKSHKFQFKHKLSDGQIRDVEVFTGPINLRDESYLFSIVHDITDRKKAESKIIKLSFHDKLTGLYNRAYMEEEMNRVDTKRQLPISIIMGDLNNLKLVNDTYGHQVGDELLIRTAEIIKSSCRNEDIIARWGGDEFVILLPETPLEDAEKICTRITDCARNQDKNLLVSIALGSTSKNQANEDIFEILNRAETRMYKNKITNRKSARSNVLSAFLNTLREKSFETENHARRMEKLCLKLGKKVGLSGADLDRLSLLTSLHDIGKVTVPQEILNKKDKLNEGEWKVIKGHTEAGYRIVSTMDEFADIAEYILYHHESWNGQGYPEGLSGEDIPLLSRILSLVDAYDVMISGRPYKNAMSIKEVKAEIERCSGGQFDPELTKIFLKMI
ncbi:MAG: diguanylate cyclase, partial [Halanaerobiales bacterium]|nr:diguanylate cyclase [Halanaerobiales bacterium]